MLTTLTALPDYLPFKLGDRLRHLGPGLAICAALALVATQLGEHVRWLVAHGFSPLTLALAFGTVFGNVMDSRLAAHSAAGVAFSRQSLLRAGVVLYGLRVTLQDVAHLGVTGIAIDGIVLMSTFTLGTLLGMRLLGLDRRTAMLISAGSAICGAAAVMATAPVLRARAEQVTLAVASVVLFGSLATLAYPWLFAINQTWTFIPGGQSGFGIYAGSTIHEVAQVAAATQGFGAAGANGAMIAKMVRVMMLAPFLFALAAWLPGGNSGGDEGSDDSGAQQTGRRIAVPWFALGFMMMVGFNSLHCLPRQALDLLNGAGGLLLAMGMAALGTATNFQVIWRAGLRPALLGLILFGWLIIGGAAINAALRGLL